MWKLIAPHTRKDGKKIRFYYVRGKYCGIRLDRSTGTSEARPARRILDTWEKQAERGEFKLGEPEPERAAPTFASAAVAYMRAGGDGQFLEPILKAWPSKMLADIDQIAIDTVAAELYPLATPQTRNRQVYTPISAVMKRAGFKMAVERPIGWKGKKSTSWLEPDQAFALFDQADKIDAEFGLLCRFLLYTGMRIEEALSRQLRHLQIERAYIYLDDSKTGEPRGCHLPPFLAQAFRDQPPRKPRAEVVTAVVKGVKGFVKGGRGVGRNVDDAGVPFLERHQEAKLFRFHQGGALYKMLRAAMRGAGLSFPRRQGGFHIFCHSYGSWMHRWGELDTHGLTRTGRWADADSADRYVHTEASEEARRSDRMPTPSGGQVVDIKTRVS